MVWILGEGKRMSISSALSSVLKKATQSAFPSIRENPAIEYSVNGFRFVIEQWLIEFSYNNCIQFQVY
jgi:hypothetical protein